MEQIQIRLTLKTAIILMLIFNFFSVATAQEKALNSNQQSQDSLKYIKTKQFLDSLRTNKDVYYGEGTALIENDIGEAFSTAKNRALDALASQIKVEVRSNVQQIVTSTTEKIDGVFSEKIEESFENKINTYTERVLTNVNESENFIDYPESGNITKAVYINKDIYNERVSKDLEAKKKSIRTSIDNGNIKFAGNHHLQAVKDWLLANEKRHDFFNNLPLQDNLGENNNLHDVAAYINGKITFFFSGLSFEDITGNTRYDANGRLNKPVMIFAKYKDENGQEQPVSRLPLKVDFLQGEGNILKGITTGTYGQAKLHVSYINPGNRNTIIRITIDTDRISGLNKFQNLLLPAVDVLLKKTSTVALSVSFNNSGRYYSPEELKNTIQSKLLKQGLAVEIVSISSADVNDGDIQRLKQKYVDYLFYVYINTIRSSTVGGYDNMYVAPCTGTVFVYELPQGNLVASMQLQTINGYGASSDGAGWDGYNKLKESILNAAQIMLEEIR